MPSDQGLQAFNFLLGFIALYVGIIKVILATRLPSPLSEKILGHIRILSSVLAVKLTSALVLLFGSDIGAFLRSFPDVFDPTLELPAPIWDLLYKTTEVVLGGALVVFLLKIAWETYRLPQVTRKVRTPR